MLAQMMAAIEGTVAPTALSTPTGAIEPAAMGNGIVESFACAIADVCW